MAIAFRSPPKDCIHHTDRGSQYAGNNFKAILAQNEFVGSMSRKGDCWDKAGAESFVHTLKVELVHRNKFKKKYSVLYFLHYGAVMQHFQQCSIIKEGRLLMYLQLQHEE